MKNAIQTNSYRTLNYFTPLLLLLALLMAMPAFAQYYNWERDSRQAQREVDENYGSGGKLSKEIKKNMAECKDAVRTTDKDLEKILTPDMKKLISATASFYEKLNRIGNDPNITQVKKQNLVKELLENYQNEIGKFAYLEKDELKIPASILGVKVFDFGKDKKITHSASAGKQSYYLLGYYAGYPIYANFTATEEFMRNADRGRYDIDGIIYGFSAGEFKTFYPVPDIVRAFNPTMYKDFPTVVYMLDIQQKSAKEQKVQAASESQDSNDDKKFKTVKIGTQTWIAENLNIKTGNSVCYENKEDYCKKYGRLYDWETAMKACPSGWHLPSKDEWEALVKLAGGKKVAGKKLKAKSGWSESKSTDSYGFSALPGGLGFSDGIFFGAGSTNGRWWTASEINKFKAYSMYMGYDGDYAEYDDGEKNSLFSVRCLQSSETQANVEAKTIKPSFNCAKAGTPTEKAICSDAELAELDARMAEDYKCLLDIDGDGYRKNSQKEFIKKRDKCGDKVECIKAAYKNQFNEFSNSTGTMHKSCGYGP